MNTAAALEYGGYGDVQGYIPAATDYPYVILDGTHKNMRAMV
jgi:hypothetical protein